jgi:para-nitrobenzyl esterase
MMPSSRRAFLTQSSLLLGGVFLDPWSRFAFAADGEAIAETAAGRVRGTMVGDIKVFKGIRYGASTAGRNRFMPPVKPTPWTGVRDALAYGPSAPQTVVRAGARLARPESEDCLVLNVFTPGLADNRKRPVMVWLHGGGFSSGSGSSALYDGVSLARTHDVVLVSINHRLNAFGFTYLGDVSSEFAKSGAVGLLDVVAALQWVKTNIERFGGDPNLVTIFGQSGGGRKVATLMAMPDAAGLFHRAVIESGAILKLLTREQAVQTTTLLRNELGLKPGQLRELQNVPMERLIAANDATEGRRPLPEVGMAAGSPTVDGVTIPNHPWDPSGPALSANIPLIIGWTRTEETYYQRPTPENLAMSDAGMRALIGKRLGADAEAVIAAYKAAYPAATPYDLNIMMTTDHPRGTYSRELAKRKAAQNAAPAYLYRFDWETPEGGGQMKSPHTVEIQFVFNNVANTGELISKRPDAHALAAKVSAAWVAFARTGDPNIKDLPKWPAYSAGLRDTMLFNTESRLAQDPDRGPRLAMEKALKLS